MPWIGAKKYTQRVVLSEPGEEEAFAVVRKMTTGEAQAMAKSVDGSTDVDKAEESLDLVAALLVEWNLCDESGALVDLANHDAVIATLQDLAPETTKQLFDTLIASIKGRTGGDAEKFPDNGAGNVAGNAAQGLAAVHPVAN